MKYTYYAYVPIGKNAMDTTCLVRHSIGVFEKFMNGEWIDAPQFFSILVGEDDDFESITEADAKKIMKKMI
jgi:hypothetical protein